MTKLNVWNRACAVLLLFAATAIASPAQTFTTRFSFDFFSDGADPTFPSLVQGLDGSLYGTTSFGGPNGGGTVFRITPEGTLTTLYNFCVSDGCNVAHGQYPEGGVVQGNDGNIYGTTEYGGANAIWGTVFKITRNTRLRTLYSFCPLPGCSDGSDPVAGLVQATNGNFYGTTSGGGNGWGTVFSITSGGTFTNVYAFCALPSCADGGEPLAGLTEGTDGNLYGTTSRYGAHRDAGTIFKLTLGGEFKTLYNFCSHKRGSQCRDGQYPQMALVEGTDGNFYGSTNAGGENGPNSNGGTIFKITPHGALTTIYSFCSQIDCTDGESPISTLVQGTDGNFYGTTQFSSGGPVGTIFRITPEGALTTLYTFCSQTDCADGGAPLAGLVQATNGKFYGATSTGGADNYGTAFSLDVGLGPFVETLPTVGKAGRPVYILGTNLTGATAVSFNGTAARFTVVSATEITATAPTGATTGFVSVTTPSGILTSNKQFQVKP
jgi:uncharacterized repeat protein (TIGR03803 family)